MQNEGRVKACWLVVRLVSGRSPSGAAIAKLKASSHILVKKRVLGKDAHFCRHRDVSSIGGLYAAYLYAACTA